MNEVTRIHLGRQPYTVSVEAHRDLKHYLADIHKNVGDEEVVNEVELRMSELLIERGITSEKVILPEDVDYLKQQLGDPGDFSDDDSDHETKTSEDKGSKRLFRDTDNALVAGVAAGVASYFGLEVVLVRLIFVIVTFFSFGMGILLYILLWLVVPPANSASEKLQMQGKPVTLEALKDSVDKADLKGSARRANSVVVSALNVLFRIGVKIVGIGLILTGLASLVLVAFTKMYMLLHDGKLFQENLFPIGTREEWLAMIGLGLVVIGGIFLIITGIAALKRKWPIGAWVTGLLVGIFLVGSTAAMALTADTIPRVRDRYETNLHTTAIQNIQPFSKVVTNGQIDIAYISSPNYAVNIHYYDHPDLSKVKISVVNNELHIDSTQLDAVNHCNMLCIFPRYNMTVQVYAPNVQDFITPPKTDIFYPAPAALN